jgi:hypothetical protein
VTTEVIVAVYEPPAAGLPYLAVAIVSNEVVETLTAKTAEEARGLMDRVGDELSKILRAYPRRSRVKRKCLSTAPN